ATSAKSQVRYAGANWKIVTIPLTALQKKEDANLARVGLFKALNHTAMDAQEIYVGEDVSEGHCAVYAIDVDQLWPGKGQRKWQVISQLEERQPFSPAPRQSARTFDGNQPVQADRLVYNALYGNIYNE